MCIIVISKPQRFAVAQRIRAAVFTSLLSLVAALLIITNAVAFTVHAQTPSAFTYQGRLTDAGAPATGTYDLQFALFDTVSGGAQAGETLVRDDVAVVNGVFTVTLDFDAPVFTSTAAKFLEIGVRPGASEGDFTLLAPRQPITSSPYAVQTINAEQLGGFPASEYVRKTAGGTDFIQNTTTQQANANFNIVGTGIVGGTLGVGTTPASGFKFDVNGSAQVRQVGASRENSIRFEPQSTPRISLIDGGAKGFITFDNLGFHLFAGLGPTFNSDNGITIVPSSGKVGIGTGTPSSGLEIVRNWDGQFGALTLRGDKPSIRFSGGAVTGNQQWLLHQGSSGVAGSLQFYNGGTTGNFGEPKMSLSPNGNVGIGTSAPQAKFHAAGGSSWFQGDSTPLPAAAGKGIVVGFAGEQGYIQSFDYGTFTGKNLLLNNSGGNVGINTSNPTQARLQVEGGTQNGIVAATQSANRYALFANGNVGQSRDKGGTIKAMLYITYTSDTATIARCYDGVVLASSNGCSSIVFRNGGFNNNIRVAFPYTISDRFLSLTPLNGESLFNIQSVTVDVIVPFSGSGSFFLYVY